MLRQRRRLLSTRRKELHSSCGETDSDEEEDEGGDRTRHQGPAREEDRELLRLSL